MGTDLFIMARVGLLLATVVASVSAQYSSDVVMLTSKNWQEMLDSPHGYFLNVCRDG